MGAVDAVTGAVGPQVMQLVQLVEAGNIGNMFQGGFDQISSINISFDLPDIQELISGLKELFSCEEETKCTDIKQPSMLTGNAPTTGGDFLSMVGGIMSGQLRIFPRTYWICDGCS